MPAIVHLPPAPSGPSSPEALALEREHEARHRAFLEAHLGLPPGSLDDEAYAVACDVLYGDLTIDVEPPPEDAQRFVAAVSEEAERARAAGWIA